MHQWQELLWIEPKKEPALLQAFVDEFNIHPVTAQVLISRKFKTPKDIHDFLYSKLPNLIDPDSFPQMAQATARIHKSANKKEKILIFGDNDVDGMTGTALLVDFLTVLGIETDFYIAQRTAFAGDILADVKDYAIKHDCKLIITVDCGITSVQGIKEITESGIDVIITDHHEPGEEVPKCTAILNPKLINSTYPNKDLTGVGVAFKLAHAFTNSCMTKGNLHNLHIDLKRFLDLVALGTVADMGALVDENRILVRYGLQQIQRSKRVGLIKLLKLCGVKNTEINTTDIASKVAPRLNSLGRISDPNKGVELLLTQENRLAEDLAKELDLKNTERQQIERKDSEEVDIILSENTEVLDNRAIVLHSENWHPGIIPIITAKTTKKYNKPTAIISVDNGIGKGSIRTIPEFPVLPILKECAHLMLNFGGHDYAAGMTIEESNIPAFKEHFVKRANEQLSDFDIKPKLELDAQAEFTDLTFEFLESLNLLEPFGHENPAPILYCTAKQVWPPKVVGKTHLKMYLEKDDRFLEGIGFSMAHRKSELTQKNLKILIAFTPQVNNYLNKSSIQLLIKDFKILEERDLTVTV